MNKSCKKSRQMMGKLILAGAAACLIILVPVLVVSLSHSKKEAGKAPDTSKDLSMEGTKTPEGNAGSKENALPTDNPNGVSKTEVGQESIPETKSESQQTGVSKQENGVDFGSTVSGDDTGTGNSDSNEGGSADDGKTPLTDWFGKEEGYGPVVR